MHINGSEKHRKAKGAMRKDTSYHITIKVNESLKLDGTKHVCEQEPHTQHPVIGQATIVFHLQNQQRKTLREGSKYMMKNVKINKDQA